jgi:hypothetical protein
MAEQATSTQPDVTTGSRSAPGDPREQLNRSREEVLRLRDLLISKDAELGSLKGQVAQLEAGTARLLSLVARVRSLIPGFVWSAVAVLRSRSARD